MGNFSCPNANEAAWHACAGGSKFVGCCLQDPCTYGCLGLNLIAASFNTEIADDIPQLQCGTGAQFYTCTSSAFWGCCKVDACASGCSTSNLSPATLVSNQEAIAVYSPTGVSSSSPTASTTKKSSSSNGAIIGGAVGGAIGAVLVGILIFLLLRRRRRIKEKKAAENSYDGRAAELSASKSVRAKSKAI